MRRNDRSASGPTSQTCRQEKAYGAGKATTMRMIMGPDRPDAGQVRFGGKSYRDSRWPLAAR